MRETYRSTTAREADPRASDNERHRTPKSRGQLMVAERALQQAALGDEVVTPIEALSLNEWCDRIKSATDKVSEINKQAESLSGLALLAYLESTHSAYDELLALSTQVPPYHGGSLIDAKHEVEVTKTTKERLSLPHSFTTEMGSVYRYNDDGSLHRDKFDGTSHDQDIAVFLPDDDDTNGNSIALIRYHQSETEHRDRNTYIIEFEETADGSVDFSKYRKVYKAQDVDNPDKLALVLLRSDGTFDRASKVSLQPVEGAYVFEMSKRPDGSTSRHPGHKVSSITSTVENSEKSKIVFEHEDSKISEKNSYQGGWGFFNEGNSLNPSEYQVTANDDLWVAELLGKAEEPIDNAYEQKNTVLSPDQKLIANRGTARAAALMLGLKPENYPTMRHIRDYIDKLTLDPSQRERYQLIKAHGRDVHYQNIQSKLDRGLSAAMEDGWKYKDFNGELKEGQLGIDYLHIGRPRHVPESPDKLDNIMRVYVYAKPEYAGEIAATVIEKVHEKTGRYLYGKLWDISTSNNTRFKDDNLLFYVQRHSDMGAVAEVLRELTISHPDMFAHNARPTDRARKTDIPAVALGEEPIQSGDMRESFNGHRDTMSGEIEEQVLHQIFSNEDIPQIYRTKAGQASSNWALRELLREAYSSLDVTTKHRLHDKTKNAFRSIAKSISPKYNVSPDNFAMNIR